MAPPGKARRPQTDQPTRSEDPADQTTLSGGPRYSPCVGARPRQRQVMGGRCSPTRHCRRSAWSTTSSPTTDLIKQETCLAEAQILLCGPRVMIRGLRKDLQAHGVPASHIHLEDFEYF